MAEWRGGDAVSCCPSANVLSAVGELRRRRIWIHLADGSVYSQSFAWTAQLVRTAERASAQANVDEG